ncbi:N-acetylglucosamine-6-phosphate deacetylase [Salinispira pacifica]|uniref:N-acetylglucosamine-6-phosphate deacetylase n=1 Tax=Salinispira pacifica TaxID=1307761 RepID=V5WJN3_9SPIO|nr:N-acetylglucosamine-6-phosphate deacetylase [Salinispira pacifica]AHC15983.1 N-acetylglucosamine-6-phosphate deacetylase [Salinispira pacifica]
MNRIVLYNATVFTGVTKVEKSAVLIEDGIIADVFSEKRFSQKSFPPGTELYDLEGAFLGPGLIDTHIHGLHGHGTDDLTIDAVVAMSDALVEYGVTSFCPTIYPQQDEDFIASIKASADAMGKETGAEILGLHLEGPFINPEKRGVQIPEYMKGVDLSLMEEYYRTARGQITNMTVAPELKNMRELALYCAKKGIVLQAGHSSASYDQMREGMEAGITHATHFFNAMRKMHHRDPGLVGAILIHPELTCELIADGEHVHPAIVQLLVKEKAADKICLVTDAIKPTNQKGGCLLANQEEVYLGEDKVFHRTKDDVIAGSALTLNRGVGNMVDWGISPTDALLMASYSPANILGFHKEIGSLLPGRKANLAVFDREFNAVATLVNGNFLKKEI